MAGHGWMDGQCNGGGFGPLKEVGMGRRASLLSLKNDDLLALPAR